MKVFLVIRGSNIQAFTTEKLAKANLEKEGEGVLQVVVVQAQPYKKAVKTPAAATA